MTAAFLRFREFLATDGEAGQGLVEYGMILVLIAVVIIVVLVLLGNQIKNMFCNVSGGVTQ